MGIVIKSNVGVKATEAGVSRREVVAEVLRDSQYWGQAEGQVNVGGVAVAYRRVRRVAENGRVTRLLVAELGELGSW